MSVKIVGSIMNYYRTKMYNYTYMNYYAIQNT